MNGESKNGAKQTRPGVTAAAQAIAHLIRRLAGYGANDRADVFDLAIRLLGKGGVVVVEGLVVGSRLQRLGNRYRIELLDGLPDAELACAQELARWAMRAVWRVDRDDEWRCALLIGPALLRPSSECPVTRVWGLPIEVETHAGVQ
jgi:hypothetical protein